jgi:hypothetical protein
MGVMEKSAHPVRRAARGSPDRQAQAANQAWDLRVHLVLRDLPTEARRALQGRRATRVCLAIQAQLALRARLGPTARLDRRVRPAWRGRRGRVARMVWRVRLATWGSVAQMVRQVWRARQETSDRREQLACGEHRRQRAVKGRGEWTVQPVVRVRPVRRDSPTTWPVHWELREPPDRAWRVQMVRREVRARRAHWIR